MDHRWITLASVLVLCAPGTVWGDQAFSLPLPELVGPVAFPGDGIQVDFDFEREFTDIERVVLIVRAIGFPALVQTCVGGFVRSWDEDLEEWQQEEPLCETKPMSFDFLVSLTGETTEQHTNTTVGDFRGYSLERAGVFQRAFGAYSFDQLRGGQGSLTLWWNGLLSGGGSTITVLEPPAIEILDAMLLVEATPATDPIPVPEPSPFAGQTAALVALAAARALPRWRS